MPISGHFHFRDCKALLVTSLTPVSGAITSVQTFTFGKGKNLYYQTSSPRILEWSIEPCVAGGYSEVRQRPTDSQRVVLCCQMLLVLTDRRVVPSTAEHLLQLAELELNFQTNKPLIRHKLKSRALWLKIISAFRQSVQR